MPSRWAETYVKLAAFARPGSRLLYFWKIDRRNGCEGEEYPRRIRQGGRAEDCKLSRGKHGEVHSGAER